VKVPTFDIIVNNGVIGSLSFTLKLYNLRRLNRVAAP
jgi:hypothetical protein